MAGHRMRPLIMGNVRTGGLYCEFIPIREHSYINLCDVFAAFSKEEKLGGFFPFARADMGLHFPCQPKGLFQVCFI